MDKIYNADMTWNVFFVLISRDAKAWLPGSGTHVVCNFLQSF